MSHDEGNNDAKKSDAASGRPVSLSDTQPGVPDIELSRTLPTGAALQVDWEPGAPRAPKTVPLSAAASDANGPLTFGTTRREFSDGPKLTAREKGKRNMLMQTLQMPLTVTLPPVAASASSPAPSSERTPRRTDSPVPAGWTSVQRVGSASNDEAERPAARDSNRPLTPHTEPANYAYDVNRELEAAATRELPRERDRERERERENTRPTTQSAPPSTSQFDWSRPPPTARDRHRERERPPLDYDRTTLPGGARPVRLPALAAREWLFVALLACASAATLYSLLIDDTTRATEEDTDAATNSEHVVTPAAPGAASVAPAVPGAAANMTVIVSEPGEAEIVLGGEVIGTTPAQVARGTKGADYLVRKAGFEPQLVRVTPNSPNSITITLHAK